jgi:threonylcarbamoyladenosine tRNA methylthiotransferase MtaB
MPDQLSHNVKRMRSRQMHALAQAGRRQILARAVGQVFEVLIEGRSGGDAGWSGYTPNYLRVAIEGDTLADLDNRIIRVRATALTADGERLLARPL